MNLISIESRRVSASLARFRWSLLWCGIHLDQSTDVFDVCVIVKLLIKPSPHQGQHEISGMKLILWTKPRRHSLTASVGHLHASTLRPSTRRDVFTLRLFVQPPDVTSSCFDSSSSHQTWRLHASALRPSTIHEALFYVPEKTIKGVYQDYQPCSMTSHICIYTIYESVCNARLKNDVILLENCTWRHHSQIPIFIQKQILFCTWTCDVKSF